MFLSIKQRIQLLLHAIIHDFTSIYDAQLIVTAQSIDHKAKFYFYVFILQSSCQRAIKLMEDVKLVLKTILILKVSLLIIERVVVMTNVKKIVNMPKKVIFSMSFGKICLQKSISSNAFPLHCPKFSPIVIKINSNSTSPYDLLFMHSKNKLLIFIRTHLNYFQ